MITKYTDPKLSFISTNEGKLSLSFYEKDNKNHVFEVIFSKSDTKAIQGLFMILKESEDKLNKELNKNN